MFPCEHTISVTEKPQTVCQKMTRDVAFTDLTPDKSMPEKAVFESQTSRAYHGKGEATEYSDSTESGLSPTDSVTILVKLCTTNTMNSVSE
jgi:hypothetical protein